MATPLTGQKVVSGTAQQLASVSQTVAAWTLKAPLTNKGPAFIGDSTVTTSTGHQFDPGDEMEYERSTKNGEQKYEVGPNDCYVVGTAGSGDKFTWFASPGT